MYALQGFDREVEGDSGMISRTLDLEGKLLVKDGILFISNSNDLIDKLQSGKYKKGGQVAGEMKELMAENIFAAIVDMTNIREITDDYEGMGFEQMEVHTNRKQAKGVMKLENKKQNSLKTIFEKLNEEYVKKQEERDSQI